MSLSSELVSLFAKATKDEKKDQNGSTVYGTVVYDGKAYVKLDGSDLLTPITTTTDVQDGERVTVMIKNHTATVTGNISSPAARNKDVQNVGSKISEFETIIAYKVSTEDLTAVNAAIQNLQAISATLTDATIVNAEIEKLHAKFATLDKVTATDVEALNADIENLHATFIESTDISTEQLNAVNAEINNLKGYTADFTYVFADELNALNATIKELDTTKLSAESAKITYANIDFTNIGKAAMEYFYSTSGLIKDVTVGDATIAGELVGVTIKGDLIEGNTIKADKLVIKDSKDGLYYKLNFEAGTFTGGEVVPEDSLHGSVITAKSITAEKVTIKDLVAFDATIAGFNITDDAIYSGVKETVGNNARGIYMDKTGQIAFGDATNFLKYYKDQNGVYRLEISAGSIKLGSSSANLDETIADLSDKLENTRVGARNLIRRSANLLFSGYYFTGPFKTSYDGVSKLTITCGASLSGDGAGNILLRTSATVSNDGAGNVKIT